MKSKSLAQIREIVRENRIDGRHPFDNLESSEIGEWNRALMFGDNDEAFPDEAEWSAIVD